MKPKKMPKEKLKVRYNIPSILILTLTIGLVIGYIAGPSLYSIHSDCTDSLLWSQITLETGNILDENFRYAAILPVGASLWMVPILGIFGYTVTAHVVSMSVFAILFVLAVYSLFRGAKWNETSSALASMMITLLLSTTAKLREIMWEHTIYYSLSILFVVVLLNLTLRILNIMEESKNKLPNRFWVLVGMLLLLSIGCGTDGFQVLAISVLPVAAALAAHRFFHKDPLLSNGTWKSVALIGIMAVGTIIGVLILCGWTNGGEISAGYAAAYTVWTDVSSWMDNLKELVPDYIQLFTTAVPATKSMISVLSVAALLMLLGLAVITAGPIFLICRYRKLETAAQLMLWVHLVVSAVVLFGWICGKLSVANWRLIPMLGTSLLSTMFAIGDLWKNKGLLRRIGVLMLCVILITSAVAPVTIMKEYKSQRTTVRAEKEVATVLQEQAPSLGYATFWNCNIITLLSDGRVDMLNTIIQDGEVCPRLYQTRKDQFNHRKQANESCFLLLTGSEYNTLKQNGYLNELSQENTILEEISCRGYYILILEKDLFHNYSGSIYS